jgi:hypothetical protein
MKWNISVTKISDRIGFSRVKGYFLSPQRPYRLWSLLSNVYGRSSISGVKAATASSIYFNRSITSTPVGLMAMYLGSPSYDLQVYVSLFVSSVNSSGSKRNLCYSYICKD